MKKLGILLMNDLRQIFRDQTLTFFLAIPFALIAFVRYFLPCLTELYPAVAEYHRYIMMSGAIQTSTMFGFITAFIFLDEKDENVLQVIRVFPISPQYFLLLRLTFATVFSTFGAFLMICLSGIAFPGFFNAALLAFLYGLAAPIIALTLATFANNKVEGIAYFKGLNLLLLLPMAVFFVSFPVKYLAAIVPTFWTYSLYDVSLDNGNVIFYFLVGLAVHFIVLGILFYQFRKRIFDR